MSILTKEMLPFKLRAKRHRGNMLSCLERRDDAKAEEEYQRAQLAIDEAFQLLNQYEQPEPDASGQAGEGEIAVAEQLADFWGIQGGLYRSRGSKSQGIASHNALDSAIGAYDHGWLYESSPRFNILNSYNTVNRLILRILRNPVTLQLEVPVEGLEKNMLGLLEDAALLIDRQIDKGRQDLAWALADLSLIELLRDGDDLNSILDDLERQTLTDKYPFESMLNVIRDLLQADVQPRQRMVLIGEQIRMKLPEAMKGSPLQM